jgi:DNA-binding response OmpR family regulator
VKNGESLQKRESASASTRCQTRPSKRILLVDDDALIRQLCAQVLRCFGYQTETAKDGAVAWKALRAKSFDLLITDNNMPKISGVDLVKKVRSAHMALPVILVSGNLPTRELDRNRWLQPVATLATPFTGHQLVGTVKKVLHETQSARKQVELPPTFSQGKFGHRARRQRSGPPTGRKPLRLSRRRFPDLP